MRRMIAGASAMLWLMIATAAADQDAEQGVLLRYRFQPGQEFRYRLKVTGDLGMTMSGAALPPGVGLPPRIPMTLSAGQVWVQKVKSVTPEGVATVSVSCDKLDTTMGFMGMSVTSRLGADGKLETLVNGQPMNGPDGADTTLPNPLAEMTVDPTGRVAGLNAETMKSMNQLFGGQNLSTLFGGTLPGVGGLILPTKPVKPGESWDVKWSLRAPIGMPGTPGGPAGATAFLALDYSVTNKLLRVEEGRAVIESRITVTSAPKGQISLSGPNGAPVKIRLVADTVDQPAAPQPQFDAIRVGVTVEKLNQSMTGTQRFRIEEGAVEGSDFDGKMDMRMAVGAPAGAPPQESAKPVPKKAAKPDAAHPRAKGAKPSSPAGRPPAASAPAPAAAVPSSLKFGVDGTLKLQLERLTVPEAGAQ